MKKSRLYLYDITENALITYPAWYLVSDKYKKDESFIDTLKILHESRTDDYPHPKSLDELLLSFKSGFYPIFKDNYLTAMITSKVYYLQSSGWKSLPVTEDIFDLMNWKLV